MLEAIGIFLLWTIIGASVGIVIGFAGFLLIETFRAFGKKEA